jgi:DNA-binding MarR family transcriptional regulator
MTSAGAIHEALLRLQRLIRRERHAAPLLLGAQETIALMLIAAHRDPIMKELVPHLKIHQSRASRLFAYLEKKQLILFVTNPNDKRARIIRFTDRGSKLLKNLHLDAKKISETVFASLSDTEVRALAGLLDKLADGFSAPADKASADEHLTDAPRRRLTVCLGLVAPEYMDDSGIDIAEYQLLFELYTSKTGAELRELIKILPFDASKISRSIAKFARRGLLKSETDRSDQRVTRVSMPQKGRVFFESLHERNNTKFEKALRHLSKAEQKRLLGLLLKVTRHAVLDTNTVIDTCSTERARYAARAFLVERSVAENTHHKLPARLLDSENVFVLRAEDGIRAMVATNADKGRISLEWIVLAPGLIISELEPLLHYALVQNDTDSFAVDERCADTVRELSSNFVFDARTSTLRRSVEF